jgi:pimeloyl-ACP methyl ester carboxylesterase
MSCRGAPDASAETAASDGLCCTVSMGRVGRILLGVMSLSWLYQRYGEARDARRYPAPGRLLSVGGHRLHLVDHGGDGPVVVVETGSGALALGWDTPARDLVPFCRVVTYDRAGYGWSDADGWKRDGQRVARDLATLLAEAEIAGPVILVGHSLGGLYVRSFQQLYPETVAGMVFVDSSHEDMVTRLIKTLGWRVVAAQAAASLLMTVAPRGCARAAANLGVLDRVIAEAVGGDSPGEVRRRLSLYLRSAFRQAMLGETLGVPATMRSLRENRHALSIPIAVVTAASPPAGDKTILARMRSLWLELQADLAALSNDASHVVARRGGHFVQNDDPEVVVKAIRGVLERATLA